MYEFYIPRYHMFHQHKTISTDSVLRFENTYLLIEPINIHPHNRDYFYLVITPSNKYLRYSIKFIYTISTMLLFIIP